MALQRKSQNEQSNEPIANTLTSFTITGSNIGFPKKTLTKDDNSNSKKLLSYIFDGFFDLKKKLDQDTMQELKKNIPFDIDKEKLSKTDPSTVLMYIKDIAKHLIQIHENDENEENGNPSNHYEVEIQKLEADVRQHIRLEQQLKICVDKNQEKIEEYQKMGNDKIQKNMKDLNLEQDNLKYELEKKEKEMEKLLAEIKQKNNIISLQEEELKSFQKKKDYKEKIPLKEQDVSNNKTSRDRINEQNEFYKKEGKENVNHKRSSSTLNGFLMVQNEKTLNSFTNNPNQKNEQSLSFLKPSDNNNKQNVLKIQENFNNKMKFNENNEEQKNLYSTFTGSTNFAKELKNSPLKKTHYNIGEINSKYVQKDKNTNNFPNNDNNNSRSQSVEPQAKFYHFAKEFSKGRDANERNEEKSSNDIKNKSSIGTFDLAKTISSSNLNKSNNRDSSRLRGSKIQ